jgi:hypothetical protein
MGNTTATAVHWRELLHSHLVDGKVVKRIPHIILLRVQLGNQSVGHFSADHPVFAVDTVFLCRAARLTGELTVPDHPIEVLM